MTDQNSDTQNQAMDDYLKALEDDDTEAKRIAAGIIEWDPDVLLTVKRASGADFIRERGYCTTRADEKFGPDWLDRPEPNRHG